MSALPPPLPVLARALRLLACLALVGGGGPAAAEVVRIEITSRVDVLDGRPFGDVGPYEKIAGRVYFEFDPDDPANARIVDLGHAEVNERGRVEAWADFTVLRPKDASRGAKTALLEVSNRGGKASLGYFNGGRFSRDPSSPEDFGDGFLMRRGLTLIWVGWQWDVPPDEEGLLRLHVPLARGAGDEPIEGLVRADRVFARPATTMPLGHRSHRAYPVSDPDSPDVRLTVRDGREGPRRTIPRERWRFARETEEGRVVESRTHVHLPGGFEPGRIYELVYPAEDPRVVGLGLAAVRDMISYARHGDSPFPVEHGIAIGISQTGRFLRHFLHQGFNVDEEGRRAFDGIIAHTAGAGRGSFNHRFGQPSRDAHRFSAFFYPTDIFPFAGRLQRDPLTGRHDGLLSRYRTGDAGELAARGTGPGAEHLPKVFYTNTGYEYWGRAASLLHTSPDGGADVEPLPNVRIYHLSSGQHFVDRFPPPEDRRLSPPGRPAAYRGNPLDFLVNLRALLVEMTEWVKEGDPPPASRYPTLEAGTLAPIDEVATEFPGIPGLRFPGAIHVAYRTDYGPRWPEGIVTVQPPRLGSAFPSLVSRVDSLGNEVAGLRNVETRVPLATYTPWSLRIGMPGPEGELADFRGAFVPLPRDAAEKERTGDPRPTVESLYHSRDVYLARVRRAGGDLVEEGFLLEEDVERIVGRAARTWDWLVRRAGAN